MPAPRVFRKISSTSKLPTFVRSWITSMPKVMRTPPRTDSSGHTGAELDHLDRQRKLAAGQKGCRKTAASPQDDRKKKAERNESRHISRSIQEKSMPPHLPPVVPETQNLLEQLQIVVILFCFCSSQSF